MILPVAVVLAAILFFGALWLWYRRKTQHGIWHYHHDRLGMRRWRNGKWEFRKMTEQEAKEELDSWVW